MQRIRDFFSRHPRLATGLHVTLSILPTLLLALFAVFFIDFILHVDSPQTTFREYVGGVLGFFAVVYLYAGWAIWVLALVLYRFTAAVREKWSERLRMTLIRLNILGFIPAVLSLLGLIMLFLED